MCRCSTRSAERHPSGATISPSRPFTSARGGSPGDADDAIDGLPTNVLVAAFIARDVCCDVFERVVSDHEPMLSPYVVEAIERVMADMLGLGRGRVGWAVALLPRKGGVFEPGHLETPVCRDPGDDQVLALARDGSARALVTGDEDLLVLDSFDGVPIIPPRGFLIHPDS